MFIWEVDNPIKEVEVIGDTWLDWFFKVESLENLQNQSSNLSTLKNQSNQVSPITSTSLIGLSSGLTEIQGDVTSKLVPASQSIASGVNAYTTGVDKVSQDVIQRAVGLGWNLELK